jgi:hypothetical protein
VLEFPRILITDRAELDRRIRMLQVVVVALSPPGQPPGASQPVRGGNGGVHSDRRGAETVEEGKRSREEGDDEERKRPRIEGPLVDYGSEEGEEEEGIIRAGQEEEEETDGGGSGEADVLPRDTESAAAVSATTVKMNA